jgi:hypothetical protein
MKEAGRIAILAPSALPVAPCGLRRFSTALAAALNPFCHANRVAIMKIKGILQDLADPKYLVQ